MARGLGGKTAAAITDRVVWESRPTGVLSDAQAKWLIERCDSCASVNALAALVNVLGEAHRAPRWFVIWRLIFPRRKTARPSSKRVNPNRARRKPAHSRRLHPPCRVRHRTP